MSGGWASLGLLPEIVHVLQDEYEFLLPTDIQDECIPLLLGGVDVMASAETGSGKTIAFGLPILQLVLEEKAKQQQQQQQQAQKDNNNNNNNTMTTKDTNKTKTNTVHLSLQDRNSNIAMKHHNHIQSKQNPNIWAGCRSNYGVVQQQQQQQQHDDSNNNDNQKFVFECHVVDTQGIVRVGWSTADASLTLGIDKFGYGFGGTGKKVHDNKYDSYPQSFGNGDVISCCIEFIKQQKDNDSYNDNNNDNNDDDTTNKKKKPSLSSKPWAYISFAKNGELLGTAFTLSSNDKLKKEDAFYPTICLKNSECILKFGTANDDNNENNNDKDNNDGALKYNNLVTEHGFTPLAANMNVLIPNPRDEVSFTTTSVNNKNDNNKNCNTAGVSAIILEPTRDLAQQTYQVLQDMIELAKLPLTCSVLVGGTRNNNFKPFQQGKIDILVGTPAVIATNIKKKNIPIGNCIMFCLDEADELIKHNTDTMEHVHAIYARLLALNSVKLQVTFFSATLHDPKVQQLAETICHRPMWVDLRGKEQESKLPETVHHVVVFVDPKKSNNNNNNNDDDDNNNNNNNKNDKFITTDGVHRHGKLKQSTNWDTLSEQETLSEQIKLLKPQILLDLLETFQMDQVLIFCRTNLDCDLLEQFFKQKSEGRSLSNPYTCRVLAGMRSMDERKQNLEQFQNGEIRILVATDVAARGIHIHELPFVINYTLPDQTETYVHRIGRVGRAKRIGLAISIVSKEVQERVWFCRKPNKPPCSDTRDYEKGGNCIWYDEPKLYQDVEQHLTNNHVKMTKLEWPNISIPKEITTILKGGGYGGFADNSNSNNNGSTVRDPELDAKMKELEIGVRQVQLTERNLQNNYWKLRRQFHTATFATMETSLKNNVI